MEDCLVPAIKNIKLISISLLVFFVGIAITAFTSTSMRTAEEIFKEAQFSETARLSTQMIQREISNNLQSLRLLKTHLASKDVINRQDFSAFSYEIVKSKPSLQSLAWIPVISRSEREIFEKSTQKEGFTNFHITQMDTNGQLVTASLRDEYYPFFFLEPNSGNFQAIGYDIGSDPIRKAALQHARETKQQAATPFIVLIQETGHQKANLFLDPVFKEKFIDGDKVQSLIGYAVLALRTADLLNAAVGQFMKSMTFTIEEKPLPERDTENEMSSSTKSLENYYYTEIKVANRLWQITVRPLSNFTVQSTFKVSTFILVFGVILSTALSFQFWNFLSNGARLSVDVNEKTRQLQSSEERFSLLSRGSFIGIWEWPDVVSDREYWSPSYYALIGYSSGEIPATFESFKKLVHPDDIERIAKLQKDHFDKNTKYDLEYRLLTKVHGYRWFRSSGQSVRDANGTPLRMFGTMQDIHDEKIATGRLVELLNIQRRASSQLKSLFKAIVDAVIIIDDFGKILDFSPSAEKIFGYEKKEVIGQNLNILMPEHYAQKHDGYLRSYRKTKFKTLIGSTRTLEGKRKEGTTFPMELKVEEVKGAEASYVGIIHDLTETKKSEQHRLDKTVELIRANKELEYFSSLINYDLQALTSELEQLGSISKINTVARSSILPHSQFNFAAKRIEKLTTLLTNLLLYAQTGHRGIKTEWVDLDTLIQDIIMPLDQSNFTFVINSLPIIETSTVEMTVLFRNILEDVIERHEEDKGHIVISCKEEQHRYLFSIEDNGPGIPLEVNEKIFPPMQALQPRNDRGKSNIGLEFVKKIVDANNGKISFSARDDKHNAILKIEWPRSDNLDFSKEIQTKSAFTSSNE